MKKSNLKKLVMMTLAMGALYVPGLASAEEVAAPQEFALDEVVVTANRMENKLVDTPANVSVVTSEEMERRNYQSVTEAVKNVPGVNVLGAAGSDEQYITLNGDARVLIMIDGRPVNQSKGVVSGRAGLDASTLPAADAIERIEIVKGMGSSAYGSDGIGGVINIITKSAKQNYVKLNVNTGSWGSQNYKAVVSHKEGKTGVLATLTKEKQDYIKYKEANSKNHVRRPNSASDKVAATIKVEQEIGDDQMASIYFEHSLKDGGRPNAAVGVISWGSPQWYLKDKGSELNNNLTVKYDWNKGKDNAGYIQVYRNHYNGNYYDKGSNNGDAFYRETKNGLNLQQNFKLSDTNKLVAGADWYGTKVENRMNWNSGKKLNDKSIFLQDSWEFAPTWTLNAGVRYDDHSSFGSKVTGSAAINKKLSENSHVYASWGQIFNAPTTDDLYYPAKAYSEGNPDLEPEKGNVWTVGYDTAVGKSQVGVNAFYSDIKDAISWAAGSDGKYRPYNVNKQKKRGMELNYKYNFDDNWSAFASYAYIKCEDNDVRNYTYETNQYKFGVSYTDTKWNVDLYGRGASGLSSLNYADKNYVTMDLSVNYKVQKNWKLYAKGFNITNAAYAERAGVTVSSFNGHVIDSYPAAGRRFLVGTEFTF